MIGPMTEKELHRVFAPENTVTVLGAKGSGKSNFCCVLMEALVLLGYEVWTNIHFFGYGLTKKKAFEDIVGEACNKQMLKKGITYLQVPQTIHVFSSLSELMYGMCEYGTKVVFLDEAGIVAETGTSSKTNTIKRLAYIIRHFDACLVNIAQLRGSLPPALRDELVDFEFNVHRRKRRVTLGKRGTSVNELGETFIAFPVVDTWQGLPHTKLAHDSFFISDLIIDIDLKGLLEQLGKATSSLDIINGYGRQVIDKLMMGTPIKKSGKKKVTKKELIFKDFDSGNFDYEMLAIKHNTTNGNLRVYKSEWSKIS